MKNVAGYDVSRLMVGALGTLGLVLDISLKVLPKPEIEKTLIIEKSLSDSLAFMNHLTTQRLPISASAYHDNKLYLRLSGMQAAVDRYVDHIQADQVDNANHFWQQLKDHQLSFFDTNKTLWRLSVPPATPELNLNGKTLYEWRGAQRWFVADDQQSAEEIVKTVSQVGGHAIQFKNGDRDAEVFSPLSSTLKKYHIKLKHAMDPDGLLNPGRFYSFF